MSNYNRFDAIIVDEDTEARGRLKQAAHAVVSIGKVQPYSKLKDVLARMQSGYRCDIVFISSRFGHEAIQGVIKDAKETAIGNDCIYVLVLGAKSQEGTLIADSLLAGTDGFLFEPFSVESLTEIADLAAKVKQENQKRREQAAVRILIADLVKEVSNMALRGSCAHPYFKEKKKAESIISLIRDRCGENLDSYYELLIQEMEGIPAPTTHNYTGASKRVKERMHAKAKKEKLDEIKS